MFEKRPMEWPLFISLCAYVCVCCVCMCSAGMGVASGVSAGGTYRESESVQVAALRSQLTHTQEKLIAVRKKDTRLAKVLSQKRGDLNVGKAQAMRDAGGSLQRRVLVRAIFTETE